MRILSNLFKKKSYASTKDIVRAFKLNTLQKRILKASLKMLCESGTIIKKSRNKFYVPEEIKKSWSS
jgi:hypothetical protein